jgi:predicted ferric reductase
MRDMEVSEGAVAVRHARHRAERRPGHVRRRGLVLAGAWAVTAANLAVVTWLWVRGGNLEHGDAGDVLVAIGRLTGLWSAYLVLVQVLLLARLPWLERAVGFDRLSVWHRWNGHATLDLIVAHVVFTILGYAALDKLSIPKETTSMVASYPGMITAWAGTALIVAVVVSSIVIVRRRMRYEWWYLVHLSAYAGIALAWFHQIPTGNELVLRSVADASGSRSTSSRSPCSSSGASCCRSRTRSGTGCASSKS